MKILYDHQIFSNQKYGGVSKYFVELMKRIIPEHQLNLALIFSDNYYLKENRNLFKKTNILPAKDFKGKGTIKQKLSFLNAAYSEYCISKNRFDLFHPTDYHDYFLKILKKPYIITVHDLIKFKFTDKFNNVESNMQVIEKIIKNANRIISISENTKIDIVGIFGINPEKIDVIYHGYNKSSIQNEQNPYGRYILFVGNREGYKNFNFFAETISKILIREDDLKLICVGRNFAKEEIIELKRLRILNQTVAIHASEKKLNDLYSNALVFVYPSLYEGFGMPILEAFANNCPVCLSNTSSLPEVAGDAGVYFDPYNQDSILDAVEKIIYNPEFSLAMIKAGEARLKRFSWDKTAQETIVSYERAI